MKKIAFVMAILLCLSLCACQVQEPETTAALKNVHIPAGKIEPGMTAKDVLVEVILDNQPVACRLELTFFTATGYYTMEEDEPVPEDYYIRLDVFYSLPKGLTVDDIDVVMDCDGGKYDGTGSISTDDNGCEEAWSYAFYGTEPQVETEPQEETVQPTEETEPVEETKPAETPKPTEAPKPHTHSWTEDVSKRTPVLCTSDGSKFYTCTCGETKRETIPAPGHDMKAGTLTKPTCTKEGSQTFHCTRCGEGLINEIPATGHSWSDWTYSTGRVHTRTCSACGAEEEANHNIPSGTVTCTDCGTDIIN